MQFTTIQRLKPAIAVVSVLATTLLRLHCYKVRVLAGRDEF
jgi:hypothetical protein